MTPDTTAYMIAGFSVIFIGIAAYILSMVRQAKRLSKQASALEELLEQPPENLTP